MLSLVELQDFFKESKDLVNSYQLSAVESEIVNLQQQLEKPEIWENNQLASKLNKDLSVKKNLQQTLLKFLDTLENLQIAFDLEDNDQFEEIYKSLLEQKTQLENQRFLNGKFDSHGALLSVHSGAGGLDAQDWASMLTSMYQAFCKNQAWKCSLIALSLGEEGGVKTATLAIEGEKVYGLLKEEAGVHRLVRISPFNAGKTRETSFALVEVIPDQVQDELAIKVVDSDLKWDYFMAGGKGGQSVNTTYSAVRVTHLPTNTVVVCQNERSQLQNKQMALKYLENKLAILEAKKNKELENELKGDFTSAEWGSQIRNYVLHPYKLVKDLRSGFETNDVDKILLHGELLPIIWSIKRAKK